MIIIIIFLGGVVGVEGTLVGHYDHRLHHRLQVGVIVCDVPELVIARAQTLSL